MKTTSSENLTLQNICKDLLSELPELATRIDEKILIGNLINKAKELTKADHIHVRVINWFTSELKLAYVEDNSFDKADPDLEAFYSLTLDEAISGSVFMIKKPIKSADIRTEESFNKYCKKYKTNPKYYNFLRSFGSIVAVPLLLHFNNHTKPIGVLNAIRKRRNGKLPEKFTEENALILKNFSDQIAITLRNSWLFETAMWQPTPEKNIEQICKEIIDEAIRKTGARDGKVRFVDWKTEYLVPGVIQGTKEMTDYTRLRFGMCLAGLAAAKKKPKSSNNLQKDPNFSEFSKAVTSYRKSYTAISKVLNNIRNRLKKKPQHCSEILSSCEHTKVSDGSDGANLTERLEILKKSCQDKDVSAVLTKMIKVVETSAKEWREYEVKLKVLNSEIAVPILFGDRLFGVLNVHSDKKNWFVESDQAILQILAGRVATVMMDHQYKRFKEIQEIERKMTATHRYETITEQLHNGIIKTIFLTEREDEKEKLIFPLLYSFKKPLPPKNMAESLFSGNYDYHLRKGASADEKELLEVPIREDGLGRLAVKELLSESEDVFIVREKVDDPVSNGSESAQTRGVMTTACLPLVYDGVVYGLLYIHIKVRHFFTELERELLTLFADQAAIIIKNIGGDNYSIVYGDKLFKEAIEQERRV